MLAVLVTLAVVVAALLMALNVLSTQCYTARVPSGADAMGLVVPLFASIGLGVLLLLACWLSVAQGGLSWVSTKPMVSLCITTAVALGIGFAHIGVMLAWMERCGGWVPVAGLFGGAVGPAGVGVMLLISVWMPAAREEHRLMLRGVGVMLGVIALAGWAGAAYGGFVALKDASARARQAQKSAQERAVEEARVRALSPVEALREDYAKMSDSAPLWVFIASLPDEADPGRRALMVERALRVPEFETALSETIADEHPRYRHGCLELMLAAPASARTDSWAASIAASARVSAEQIRHNAAWFTIDEFANPNPERHIVAAAEAATKVGLTDESRAALQELLVAVQTAAPNTSGHAAEAIKRALSGTR